MINLEVPPKFADLLALAHTVAEEVFRPNSRRYDHAEHSYPKELDMLAAIIDGLDAARPENVSGASGVRRGDNAPHGVRTKAGAETRNGTNLSTVLSVMELCWGDVGLLLSMPRQGLGNAAVASVATDEQLAAFGSMWAAMAITEPGCGSDSAAINTTARLDGDEYVLNGEKIYVTAGQRADAVVVWASLDRRRGRAAIKSFLVEKGRPGFEVVRLEEKLGIRASDTAALVLTDVRVPKENLLGSAEVNTDQGFAGVMQTFDNTRPLVAGMAVGVARAALERTRELLEQAGIAIDYDRPLLAQNASAAAFIEAEADYEAAYLLTLKAAWMADNGTPNSLEASMAKAKAGRSATEIALRCVALAGSVGYGEGDLLEKWARDAKILDIFEGTQQIQLLIVARRLLNRTSAQLR
jgi:acyl-CoA dehydrogenase